MKMGHGREVGGGHELQSKVSIDLLNHLWTSLESL